MVIAKEKVNSKAADTDPTFAVTVIMPTYNHAAFIGEAIGSVLCQTYPHLELIVIDNFSKDDTENIVKSFSDPRIRYYKFNNKGIIAASRNFGIKESRGKYVAFLDSDDLWLPKKLEYQVSLMERNKEFALSYVLFGRLHKDGVVRGKYPHPRRRKKGFIFKELYLLNIIGNSGAMVRTSVFDKVGWLDEDPRLVGVEDADMWLKISRKMQIGYVDHDILMLYRVGDNNRYYKKAVEKIKRRLCLASKYYPYVSIGCYLNRILIVPLYCLMNKLALERSEESIHLPPYTFH